MSAVNDDPLQFLRRSLESERIHSAYLLSGSGEAPGEAAMLFARGLVCRGAAPRPCDTCADCVRSAPGEEPIELDGTGKRGPFF